MNLNNTSYWDTAQLRMAASRERAKAMHDMRTRVTAWLRSHLTAGGTRPGPRECLDCGA